MSLAEDILDVLRMVMEYFGVHPDMVTALMHTSVTDTKLFL